MVKPHDYPVVILCASAGGLHALTRVLESIPPGLPASVIVLQHQQPDRISRLARLLQRSCSLPVRDAAHGDLLAPAEVLVVPAGVHMLIGPDARVCLVRSGNLPPPRPSADLLLCTAAVTLGARLIAVVLTGGGHDGAVGVEAVDLFGGLVIVQDPRTAFAPGMPSAALERDSPEAVELAVLGGRITKLVLTYPSLGRPQIERPTDSSRGHTGRTVFGRGR